MSDSKASAASTRRPRAGSRRTTGTAYDKNVILWSQEQARFLRAGRFAELDIDIWPTRSKTWERAKSPSSRAAWPCSWLTC